MEDGESQAKKAGVLRTDTGSQSHFNTRGKTKNLMHVTVTRSLTEL